MPRLPLLLLLLAALALALPAPASARRKRNDGDFEFADEDDVRVTPSKIGEKKRWIYDPNSDLCHPLNCLKKEICLLKDSYTAICVSKKELHKNGDIVVPGGSASMSTIGNDKDSLDKDDDVFYDSEDETEDQSDTFACEACPVVRPTFLCGSDNRTYSSLCRLDYHNCIHHTTVKVSCKGFCPCKDPDKAYKKKQQKLAAERRTKKQQTNSSHHNRAQYSFTPEDFKYDNKHYKYIKYTKYNNKLMQEKAKENSFNEVGDIKTNKVSSIHDNSIWDETNSIENNGKANNNGCSGTALESMADRLLDWFVVLMNDNSKKHSVHYQSIKGFPSDCKTEVRWMFGHLDRDTDFKLSVKDLYSLEHDEQEHCMKPFLNGCDSNRDSVVTRVEWCRCFQKADRPCNAVTRRAARNHFVGAYVPQCDSLGYYQPLQCHAAVGVCWCSDKHGNERPGTRTKGEPRCPDSDDGVSLPSDDEDGAGEGSADQPLDF